MKRIILIAGILLFFAFPVFAFQESRSSYEQEADATVYTIVSRGPMCFISAVEVITNGTDDVKLIIYDNTSNTGNVLFEMTVEGADNWGGRTWEYPVKIKVGIRGDIAGTGASYIIEYILR